MSGLPDELRRGLDAIQRATVELTAAAQEDDPSRVHEAIEHRGRAIESIGPRLRSFRAGAGPEALAMLSRERRALDAAAQEARELLGQVSGRIRATLEAHLRDRAGIRAYASASPPENALDRSG